MIIKNGNHYTGWFEDIPHLIATCESESTLRKYLYQMREVYEESLWDDEINELLFNLKIGYSEE